MGSLNQKMACKPTAQCGFNRLYSYIMQTDCRPTGATREDVIISLRSEVGHQSSHSNSAENADKNTTLKTLEQICK